MLKIVLCILILLIMPMMMGFNFILELHPVSGPLKDSGMAQSLKASFELTKVGHGKAVLNLPDDELCSGEYTMIDKEREHATFFDGSDYLRYYGDKFKINNLQYGQAIVTGTKGTVVYAEFYVSFWRRYGLARDNNNNVYKL